MEKTAHIAAEANNDRQPMPGVESGNQSALSARFPVGAFSSWMPLVIAACLMALGIYQAVKIMGLKSILRAQDADIVRLRQSNALIGLRLVIMDVRDTSYSASRIVVAWDPYQHRGVVSTQNLPAPQVGYDYQLWVLDPEAPSPLSARLIKPGPGTETFVMQSLNTPSPGFAITLEPSGGSPAPTSSILFAVEPGQ